MQVRLLGPLEVRFDAGPVAPPGSGERALLALLALNAGRVVPADRLVDALWGDDLPANPANALQLRVSKLRRWIGGAGGDAGVVVTRAPGYLLDVPAAAVDALVAPDELAAARRAADEGAPAVAAERYRSALARWEGPPLCDLPPADWAEAEATRLEELRLTGLEEVLDLELGLGRERAVLDELEALVAAQPLRERLHGLRMLALYRSGRQADALAAYQQVRELLGEQLGLDPSEELRELEGAILRQDPALDPPAEAPAFARPPELPRRLASFRGRDRDLDELDELLSTERVVTCTGPGGSGKTTLALEAARRQADRFANGAWFVPLAGTSSADDVVAATAGAFGLPATALEPGETAEGRLARQIGGRHALVVLDNCEHVVEPAALLVEALVARCPNLSVLVTSREALQIPGECRYAVVPLELPDPAAGPAQIAASPAVQVFVDRATAADRSFRPDDADLAHVAAICRRLDGLPLAVELAAARTTTLPVADIAARLDDHLGLLTGGARTADARHRTLRAAIAWSYDLLDPDEQEALRRLSVFRGPWDLGCAEAVCGALDPSDEVCDGPACGGEPGAGGPARSVDAVEVLDLVGRLVDRSLVVGAGPGRFRMLETIRQFAAADLEAEGRAHDVAERHLDHMIALASTADPGLRAGDQVRWLEALRSRNDDFRQALAFAAAHPDRHGVQGLRLAAALGWFWYLGDHEEGRRHLSRFLDQVATAPPDVRGPVLLAVSSIERPTACIVHPSEPCAEAAVEARLAFEDAGDAYGAALADVLLAVEGVRGIGADEARASLDRAGAVLAAAGDEWGEALVEFVRMEIDIRLGHHDEAIAHGDRAAAAFARLGDLWGLSSVRVHQAANLRMLGDLDGARERYQIALGVAREVGLHNSTQLISGEMGLMLAAMGEAEAAHAALSESRAAARRWGFRHGVAAAHLGHGHLARWDDDPVAAVAEYDRALVEMAGLGSYLFLAEAHSGRGYARAHLGDLDAAEADHRRVEELAAAVAEPRIAAVALEGLAGVRAAAGDPEAAARLLAGARETRTRAARPAEPLDRREVERTGASVTEQLGTERSTELLRGRPAH